MAWRPRVQALRNALETIRTRLSGLPASAKLLAGSLVVILALGLFLVAQYSARSDAVAFAITPAAYDDARTFLANRGVQYEEKDGQLLVPVDRHAGLLADFAQSGGAAELNIGDLVPSDPFAPESERGRRHLFAVQTVLSKVIGGFRNVKSATVIISPKSTAPLGSMRNAQTASVTVSMRSGRLSQEQIDAIAAMIAGTQSGMKAETACRRPWRRVQAHGCRGCRGWPQPRAEGEGREVGRGEHRHRSWNPRRAHRRERAGGDH
jgi:flagellar biosynthesis/type III secretory pathway M-ring protein FliF/YscJ